MVPPNRPGKVKAGWRSLQKAGQAEPTSRTMPPFDSKWLVLPSAMSHSLRLPDLPDLYIDSEFAFDEFHNRLWSWSFETILGSWLANQDELTNFCSGPLR